MGAKWESDFGRGWFQIDGCVLFSFPSSFRRVLCNYLWRWIWGRIRRRVFRWERKWIWNWVWRWIRKGVRSWIRNGVRRWIRNGIWSRVFSSVGGWVWRRIQRRHQRDLGLLLHGNEGGLLLISVRGCKEGPGLFPNLPWAEHHHQPIRRLWRWVCTSLYQFMPVENLTIKEMGVNVFQFALTSCFLSFKCCCNLLFLHFLGSSSGNSSPEYKRKEYGNSPEQHYPTAGSMWLHTLLKTCKEHLIITV